MDLLKNRVENNIVRGKEMRGLRGCLKEALGAGHQESSQQNSFRQVRQGNTKKGTSQSGREEATENDT